MGFDDEVDAARDRLQAALAGDDQPGVDEAALLQNLLPLVKARIASRRLAFHLGEDEGEAAIEVLHQPLDEVLGLIYVEDGEYVFESEHDDYFDDFVDEDPASFVARLYETLRADLAKFEVENEG